MVTIQPAQSGLEAAADPLSNLPRQRTSFIGREAALATVGELLAAHQLISLIGAGGMGKTRLAVEAAGRNRAAFPDGAWFVDLAALTDSALVAQAIASVFTLEPAGDNTILQVLCAYLQPRKALLLLDNCEQVLTGAASVADALLQACPGVTMLTTSRQALGIGGELVWRVPALLLPQPDQPAEPPDLLQFEAVALFVERARFKRYDFALTPANATATVDLCRRLDGIPLAIELAAARIAVLSVEEIVRRLDERFRLLTSGSRSGPLRQQTLEALLDWSYNLLDAAERQLLRGVAIFAGGFQIDAARTILAPASDEFAFIDLLGQLVDKSLLIAAETGGGTRFQMLETIREYAGEAAAAAGETALLAQRHCDYFLALAEQAEPLLQGTDQVAWLNRLSAEYDNLRVALAWAVTSGDASVACRLAGALWRFWYVRGHFEEARRWFDRALQVPGEVPPPIRAKALNGAGIIATQQSDLTAARAWLEAALQINQQRGDKTGIAGALNNLGMLLNQQGDLAGAQRFYEESLVLRREVGDLKTLAAALNNLGTTLAERGKFAAARERLDEALAIRRRLQDKWGIALLLNNLGNLAFDSGDFARARPEYEESLALRRAMDDRLGQAISLDNLARLAREEHDLPRAVELYGQSLALHQQLGGLLSSAKVLLGLAVVAARMRAYERAAQLLGQAEVIHETAGATLSNWEEVDAAEILLLRDAGHGIDPTSFAVQRALGRAMALDQALKLALAPLPERLAEDIPAAASEDAAATIPSEQSAQPDDLTAREREMLRLIAAGFNNAQMAEHLGLSRHTIQSHVRSVYNKIGIGSRSAATRYAIEHNLIAPDDPTVGN